MLFGPGGVVAVLLGLWGAWWAVLRGAGTSPRSQWPAIVAFAAAILCVTCWSAVAEPVALAAEALGRRGDARREAMGDVPLAFWAGVRGLVTGWGLLAAGVAGSRWADAPWRTFDADRAEQVLAVGAAIAAGVGALVVLIAAPQLLEDDAAAWVSGRGAAELAAWVALPAGWVGLALAGLTGARRAIRDRRTG